MFLKDYFNFEKAGSVDAIIGGCSFRTDEYINYLEKNNITKDNIVSEVSLKEDRHSFIVSNIYHIAKFLLEESPKEDLEEELIRIYTTLVELEEILERFNQYRYKNTLPLVGESLKYYNDYLNNIETDIRNLKTFLMSTNKYKSLDLNTFEIPTVIKLFIDRLIEINVIWLQDVLNIGYRVRIKF